MTIQEFEKLSILHKNKEFIFSVARVKKTTTGGVDYYGDWIIQKKPNPTDDAEVKEKAERQVNRMNQEFREKYGKHSTTEF